MNDLQKVLSFSGGRTSGYMLFREIERIGIEEYRRQFITLFCNTGKEHDATLDFVHDVETNWGVPIVWLEYRRIPAVDIPLDAMPEGKKRENLRKLQEQGENGHWFRHVTWETAAREHKRGPYDELLDWANVLPNVRTRSCSVQMKIRTMQRYLGSVGVFTWADYIGIRADEAHRKLEIMVNAPAVQELRFPLIDDNATRDVVNAFWQTHPFTLKLPVINGETVDGNCRRCFLKATWKKIRVIREDLAAGRPIWEHEKELEFTAKGAGEGAFFKKGQPYAELIKIAKALPPGPITPPPERKKPIPVKLFELDFSEQDIPCSCAVGAYRGNQADEDQP